MRKKGFENDIESGIICRYKVKGIIVDVIPTNENVLGFTNRWYPDGFKYSTQYAVDKDTNVRIFRPEYFIASKLEAYKNRGNNDGRMSSDFEDIIYILNNRNTIWEEMKNASEDVIIFLKYEFSTLLEQNYFYEWVSAHLEYAEQRRVNFIIGGLTTFINEQ